MAGARRLLAALLVVAAPLVSVGEAGCLPWPCKVDPIDLLNDKLVDLTDSMDLADNVRAARGYMIEEEFKKHLDFKFKLAVSQFSMLDAKDLCNIRNFDLMRSLLELASRKNLEDIRVSGARRRLIRLLHNVRHEFKFKCFARLDRAWSDQRGRTDYFEQNMVQLTNLNSLLESHAEKTILQKEAEVKQLNGAVQLEKRHKSVKNTADLFTGEEVKEVLMAVNKQLTGFRALKVNEKTGKPLKLDLESADRPLQVYLLDPCRRLMKEATAIATILKPLLNIASIILVDDLVKPLGFRHRFYAAEWAARYAACNLLLEADAGQLAAKVAKVRQLN